MSQRGTSQGVRVRRGWRGLMPSIITAALALATLVTGLYGWTSAGKGWLDALYLTLLAFTGDSVYVGVSLTGPEYDALGTELVWTRFLGLLTTVSAVLAALSALLATSLACRQASKRRGHAVLIGASSFGLESVRRRWTGRSITVLGPSARAISHRRGQLHLDVDADDTPLVSRLMGRPDLVVFGSDDTVSNVVRARALMPALKNADTLLRVEDIALVRDLAHLSPDLGAVQPVSSAETVAEAVVYSLAASEMARLRGQPGVHALLVGGGTTNLAIAEQLAVTCYHSPGDSGQKLRLTILDRDKAATDARVDGLSPGLRSVANVNVESMEALNCLSDLCLKTLEEIDRTQPVTAIFIATGDDARNAAIGMRLRQVQLNRLIIKAPILVRNHMRTGYASPPLDDISGGIHDFGGDTSGPGDPALSDFEDKLAEEIHQKWCGIARKEWEQKKRVDAPVPWSGLTAHQKRSARLAARATPHMLRAAGLVPDPGSVTANMALAGGATPYLQAQMERLKKIEHNRWMAEKRLDGWTKADDGESRDDERRRHTSLLEWEDLSDGDRDKDIDNINIMIGHCRDRKLARSQTARWRRRLRVGVMGPLATGEDSLPAIEDTFRRHIQDWKFDTPLEACNLEVLTPDAPGFDRIAPLAILRVWRQITGRPGHIILMRAASQSLLDERAARALLERRMAATGETEVKAEAGLITLFRAQSRSLASVTSGGPSSHRATSVDMRLSGQSDADLRSGGAKEYSANDDRVALLIDELSDLLVWGRSETSGMHARQIAEQRGDRASLPVDVPDTGTGAAAG